MSLLSIVDVLKKEFRTLGVPDIVELALLSSQGKVLYTDLSKATMSRVSPFYHNILIMGKGDNLTLTLDPVKTIVASRVSNKAVLITLTDKKVGIVLSKMGTLADKYGSLIDEVIALEDSRAQAAAPPPQAPKEATPTSVQLERPVERVQPPPPPEPEATAQPEPIIEEVQPQPTPLLPAQPQPPPDIQPSEEETTPTSPPQSQPPASPPPPEIVNLATRIVDDARMENRILRVLGGVAVAMRCPSASQPPLARDYPDVDLFAHAKDDIAIKKMLASLGFEPIKKFNALHGRKRLKFFDEKTGIGVDVYLDAFEMCHKLDLKDRLELDEYTIPLADLLMTKLQIVKFSERDARDTTAIMLDHELGSGDPGKIDVKYIAKLCSDDWGLYKTLSMNTEKMSQMLAEYRLPEDENGKVLARLADFLKQLDDEPKTKKWQKRAEVGEKSQWYETVE
ncbi:MAG: hypothetical protein WED04_09225 [Promethearchaeati archaeon SRVP18_Atabeyarchaeia-1]